MSVLLNLFLFEDLFSKLFLAELFDWRRTNFSPGLTSFKQIV